jgi:hypothetical protein
MTRIEQIEEAIRVRPSKAALAALREELIAAEEMADDPCSSLAAGALRILIEMHDKLPPPVKAVTP